MDVVGSEIGQKMRSAIKAKLTELGCYVDDELPDYVMVMVANKRTRIQMEDDLQLFLGDNTQLFVNWLHQVLKKLQEVTVAAPVLMTAERDKSKERSLSKDQKPKEKKSKDKHKKSDSKKAKKKDKEKLFRKKDDKKIHKSKKKSKHHEMIRPNVPPLLMNMEKQSEPSITDVFAGQILKNHGISLDSPKEEAKEEEKPSITEIKRPILPIIDPATILSQSELDSNTTQEDGTNEQASDPKEDQINEINQIEAKIQGLKQKLAEQLDSMSDDEDFLNIRTEAEELMNDFAEDVFQEISQQTPVIRTPPIDASKSPTPPPIIHKTIEVPTVSSKDPVEALPQIELNLPKRPIRERLGARTEPKKHPQNKERDWTKSPERFTPDREPEQRSQKSSKSRLAELPEAIKKSSLSDDSDFDKPLESSNKKLTSRVSVLENRPNRTSCASVVRVRPRPRVSAPSSSLLMRAMADAHKSLLNTPNIKVNKETQQVKRALVLPMRRCVESQKIVIQVPTDNSQETGDSISLGGDMDSDDDKIERLANNLNKNELLPNITKKIINNPLSMRNEGRTTIRKDDSLIIETINIHNPSLGRDKNTQFIVTMDGFNPNAFLAKKLQTEGLLNDEDEISKDIKEKGNAPKVKDPKQKEKDVRPIEKDISRKIDKDKSKSTEKDIPLTTEKDVYRITDKIVENNPKRLSNTSDDSETQVIIKKDEIMDKNEKRKGIDISENLPPTKKRKASPIVFNVNKEEKEIERVRERKESISSDATTTVTTVTNSHKYDTVPPLSSSSDRTPVWCRTFPACRYGSACAFAHPRCKFLAACTRRNCVYSHSPNAPIAPATLTSSVAPSVASHVVPAANYKSISAVVPNICKFYPNCVNPACHFYHPKPCRYGNNCAKIVCNFYHADGPPKWRYPV